MNFKKSFVKMCENGVSGGGGVNIEDPVPLHIMDWEGGRVKCDFCTLQSCDIPSHDIHDQYSFQLTLTVPTLVEDHL